MTTSRFGAFTTLVACLALVACATGHREWRQLWGDTPLYQAEATCRYQANAATPALCYGLMGCLAESARTSSLFEQCMMAAGWKSVWISDAPAPTATVSVGSGVAPVSASAAGQTSKPGYSATPKERLIGLAERAANTFAYADKCGVAYANTKKKLEEYFDRKGDDGGNAKWYMAVKKNESINIASKLLCAYSDKKMIEEDVVRIDVEAKQP